MSRKLHISDDLTLPVDAVTNTLSILAKRRAGKSYTARRIAEQFLKCGQQIVVVDPKGDWHGIRSSADGKSPGFAVVILGGEHGDVPLEAGAGEVVAKLVVEERVSVLLDLSLFRKHEVATFMTAFLENLYRFKAREQYRTPMMLIVDEADAIAPQKPQKGEERMLGAAEDIVRRGGQRGIGCTLITQRSAVLNKNVLTQSQMLIALRTIAPQDLAAMDAWIEVHGTPEERKTLMESLPSLPVGDAWFWSPGWPDNEGIFLRTHVLPIETFDSGATPKPGQKRLEPKNIADVDLDALKRQMSATIERAKADDPRELRKRIAELTKQLSAKPAADPKTKIIERNIVAPKLVTRVESAVSRLEREGNRQLETAQKLIDSGTALRQKAGEIIAELKRATGQTPAPIIRTATSSGGTFVRPVPIAPRPVRSAMTGERHGGLPIGERKILIALTQTRDGGSREYLTVATGYKRSSRDAYLQRLRDKGFVDTSGDMIRITSAGESAIGLFDPLPVGDELRSYWMSRLPEGEARILQQVIQAYPSAVDKERLSEATGYKRSSRDAYLQRLRARQLIVIDRDGVRASDMLFDSAVNA